ncbi:MAG: hypothetical protein IPK07_19490 [Deltaproteobacteria bacterium]|jgi:hypothetical protein|nr:hypothetical protein [Deltaproteobacteria bacterium]
MRRRARIAAATVGALAALALPSCGDNDEPRAELELAPGEEAELVLRVDTSNGHDGIRDVLECLLAFPDLGNFDTQTALAELDVAIHGLGKSGSHECSANVAVRAHDDAAPGRYRIRIEFTYWLATGFPNQNGNNVVVVVPDG